MEEERACSVVAALRDLGVMAHVARAGVYQFGIRVVIPDGREAIWDSDGTASLEAQIMRDGVLVGFVPKIPGSADLDEAGVVAVIAGTDYDSPAVPQSRPREHTSTTDLTIGATTGTSASALRRAGPAPRMAAEAAAGMRDRLGRIFRGRR